MKYVKAFIGVFILLAALSLLVWQVWLKDQVAFAKIATAYGAKMTCSCRFVAERPIESCQNDFTVDISQVHFSETADTTTASVLGGWVSATAIYQPGTGCTLRRD